MTPHVLPSSGCEKRLCERVWDGVGGGLKSWITTLGIWMVDDLFRYPGSHVSIASGFWADGTRTPLSMRCSMYFAGLGGTSYLHVPGCFSGRGGGMLGSS